MLFSVFLFLDTLWGMYSYVQLVLFPSLLIPGVSLSAISLVLDYLEMTWYYTYKILTISLENY